MANKKHTITKDTIKKIARLSSIKVSSQDVAKFSSELSVILSEVEKLDELDTTGVKAMSHSTGLKNQLREDDIEKSLSQEDALLNVSDTSNGYFSVKMVLNK